MLSRPKYLVILLSSIMHFFALSSFAQTNTINYISSKQAALGSNMTLLPGVYGVLGNPASISESHSSLSFLVNTEQRYFLGSLNSTSITAIKKIGEYDFIGLSLGSFGIDEFQERRMTLSYSRKIAQHISLGSSVNYYLKSIEEYGSEHDFDFHFGITANLSQFLQLGVAGFNIIPKASEGYLRQNSELGIGLNYTLSNKIEWLLELRTDFQEHSIFSTGFSYQIVEKLNLQLGMNTLDNGISLGISYQMNNQWKIDASSRSNQNLGISPGLGIFHESKH